MATDREEMALRQLHDQHAAVLQRFVTGLTHDAAVADDIVQETLIRAWHSPRIMADDPTTARSWMFTVARNLVIDDARSARRRYEVGVERVPESAITDRTDALFDTILVDEALSGLSEEHRAVIVGAYFHGKSTVDLAGELGIPDGTVKSRLHYGLRTLRLLLQERGVTR